MSTMLRSSALNCFAVGLFMYSIALGDVDGAEPGNLIVNGGFEDGIKGWSYGQWKGTPQPGFIDETGAFEGKACFVMGLAGVEESRFLCIHADIDPTNDFVLSFALRGVDLPQDSVAISLLEWGTEKSSTVSPQGYVWLPSNRYAKDLIRTCGTFGWKRYELHIYRQGIKPTTKRVTLYFTRNTLSDGELCIDDVSLVPVAPVEYRSSPASHSPPRVTKPAPPAKVEKAPLPVVERESDDGPQRLLLIDRCDSAEQWGLNLGSEFPGARGKLTEERIDGRDTLKVEFDLSKGGTYTGAHTSVNLQKAESLSCTARRVGGSYFTMRIRDATGQSHAGGFHASGDQWTTIELPLNGEGFPSRWGGANDGKIHFPLRRILIAAAGGKKQQGAFWLRDLAVKTRQRGKTWQIDASTNQPGQIHFMGGPGIHVNVAVENRVREAHTVPISIRVLDLDRKEIASHEIERQFAPWQRQAIDLPLPNPGPGYFPVVVSVGDGLEKETIEAAFAIVPKPERYRQRDPNSFFAMHVDDPEVAARLGVHFSRRFHFWRYTETHPKRYSHASEYVDDCLAAGIDVMMCLDYREPSWLEPKTLASGLPTEEALRRYADWVSESVRAHPQVAVFEIQNEPNLELGRSRNLPLEASVEFYSELVQVAAPIIREEAPHARIAGCSVSGGDYDDDFAFSRPVLEQVGGMFDIYAAHPYASPRIFGPNLQCSWPADNREAVKHQAALDMLNQFLGSRHMWIGEKGWAIMEKCPLAGDTAHSFAHCLAQSLIIARSIPSIEKYFWFLQTQRHGSEGGDYTLFRRARALQPMPGAAAYANVAWQLDHCRPIESFVMADDVRVSVFERSEDSNTVATLWSTNKPFLFESELPPDAQALDLFGRTLPLRNIPLTAAPVFIRTGRLDARGLVTAIRASQLKPSQPFDVLAVSPRDVNTIEVCLANRTLSSLPVRCRIGSLEKRLVLPAVSEPVRSSIRLQPPLTMIDADEPLEVVLSAPPMWNPARFAFRQICCRSSGTRTSSSTATMMNGVTSKPCLSKASSISIHPIRSAGSAPRTSARKPVLPGMLTTSMRSSALPMTSMSSTRRPAPVKATV